MGGTEAMSGREEHSLLEEPVRQGGGAELSVWQEQRAKGTATPEETGQHLPLRIWSVCNKESYRGVLSKGYHQIYVWRDHLGICAENPLEGTEKP